MGPFLRKVGDSNSKDGPWNPEKALPVPYLIERYDNKEGLLTKKSRKEAIGKYHRKISCYSLFHGTCEPFRFSYSVARMNAGRCCSNTCIYLCLHIDEFGQVESRLLGLK